MSKLSLYLPKSTTGSGLLSLNLLRLSSGSETAPSLAFSSETNTGIYRSGASSLDFTVAGSRRLSLTGSGIRLLGAGSSTTPAYSFITDTNTGIYSNGADSLAIACGGIRTLSSTTTQINVQVAGSAASPALYLNADTTSGLYRPGANQLGIAISGSGLYIFSSTTFISNRDITLNGDITCEGATIGTSGSAITQIQFGRTASSGVDATINFPNAFSSIPTVSATLQISNTSYVFQIQITNVTTTGFSYRMSLETYGNPSQTTTAGDSCTINWIAMN